VRLVADENCDFSVVIELRLAGYDVVSITEQMAGAEIGTNGTVTPLSSDIMRARYRESLRAQKLVTAKEPLRYEFDHFTFASRLVSKGSRLALILSAGNSFGLEKNYNSGGVIADETIADSRVVKVQVFHDAKRRSALYVPIAAPEPAGTTH
jgi:hypothetical protein